MSTATISTYYRQWRQFQTCQKVHWDDERDTGARISWTFGSCTTLPVCQFRRHPTKHFHHSRPVRGVKCGESSNTVPMEYTIKCQYTFDHYVIVMPTHRDTQTDRHCHYHWTSHTCIDLIGLNLPITEWPTLFTSCIQLTSSSSSNNFEIPLAARSAMREWAICFVLIPQRFPDHSRMPFPEWQCEWPSLLLLGIRIRWDDGTWGSFSYSMRVGGENRVWQHEGRDSCRVVTLDLVTTLQESQPSSG